MLSRECSLWQRSKKESLQSQTYPLTPLRGKDTAAGISPAQGRFICIIPCGAKNTNAFSIEKAVSMQGGGFSHTFLYSSIVTCVPTPICDFNVRRSLLCMWMQALRAVPVVRRGRRSAAERWPAPASVRVQGRSLSFAAKWRAHHPSACRSPWWRDSRSPPWRAGGR